MSKATEIVPTGTEAEVCADIARRQQFGLNKYKISVAENPLELAQWVQHLYEELLDAAVYAKRILGKLEAPAVTESLAMQIREMEIKHLDQLRAIDEQFLNGLKDFHNVKRLTSDEIKRIIHPEPSSGFRLDDIVRRVEDALIKKNGGNL